MRWLREQVRDVARNLARTACCSAASAAPRDAAAAHASRRCRTERLALRGDLLDFTGDPAWGDVESDAVRFRPDHWLLIEDGRIAGAQAEAPDADAGRATTTAAG